MAALEYVTVRKLENPSKPMVVNVSLGADIGTPALNALDEAVNRAAAMGVISVVSAGNEGIMETRFAFLPFSLPPWPYPLAICGCIFSPPGYGM